MEDFSLFQISIHALNRFEERKKGKVPKNTKRQIKTLLNQSRELLYYKGKLDGTRCFVSDPWCFVVRDKIVVTVYHEGYINNPQNKRKPKGLSHSYLKTKNSRQRKQKWR
jgi:hypothetical protein